MELEQKTLMSELTQGKELARQLKNHLGGGVSAPSSVETRESLVKRLLSSYEKALSLLNWDDVNDDHKESVAQTLCGRQHHQLKRRKTLSGPSWTEQVRSWSEPSRYGANNDGYSWRKYGQKEIIGATFPRGYYRCAYHTTQGCLATKQVQRSDEDPAIFNVKYCGRHTCVQFSRSHITTSSPMDQQQQDNPESTSKEILDQNLDTKEHELKSQALTSPAITPEYVEENIFGDLGFEYFPISSSQINSGQSLASYDPVNMVSTFLPISHSSTGDIHLLNHNVDFGESYQFIDPFGLFV